MAVEIETALGTLIAALSRQPEPVFLIMDLRQMDISLDDLSRFANAAAMRPNSLLRHPMLRESLVISGDTMVMVAVSGMGGPTYGNVRIRSFETPEEALGYCHEQKPAHGEALP
jgi:hypothetical protein